jgi:hypothetical protein
LKHSKRVVTYWTYSLSHQELVKILTMPAHEPRTPRMESLIRVMDVRPAGVDIETRGNNIYIQWSEEEKNA